MLAWAEQLLSKAGYEVFTCHGAMGAGAFLVRVQPTLILCDLDMPLLSGEEFIGIIRRSPRLRHSTIVVLSSLEEGALNDVAAGCGADGWIQKSKDGVEFVEQVMGFMS